jgi:hypothetical protein
MANKLRPRVAFSLNGFVPVVHNSCYGDLSLGGEIADLEREWCKALHRTLGGVNEYFSGAAHVSEASLLFWGRLADLPLICAVLEKADELASSFHGQRDRIRGSPYAHPHVSWVDDRYWRDCRIEEYDGLESPKVAPADALRRLLSDEAAPSVSPQRGSSQSASAPAAAGGGWGPPTRPLQEWSEAEMRKLLERALALAQLGRMLPSAHSTAGADRCLVLDPGPSSIVRDFLGPDYVLPRDELVRIFACDRLCFFLPDD